MDRGLTPLRRSSSAQSLSSNHCCLALLLFILIAVPVIGFAGEQRDVIVEIVATPKSGNGPMWVRLKPEISNLEDLAKVGWSFGDGQESTEMIPKPHYYNFGRYNAILEVTYKSGKKYTASITIDASSPG